MDNKQSKSILVAANPHIWETISIALQSLGFVLTFCSSVEEAKHFLDTQHFDLIFCTIQFDRSRFFDLLKYAKKENPLTQATPFLVLKIADGFLPDSLVELTLNIAKLVGANETVNLRKWRAVLGDELAYKNLRTLIQKFC